MYKNILSLLSLIIILCSVTFLLLYDGREYSDTGIVVRQPSYSRSIVKLDNNNMELDINSSLFDVDSKVMVKYSKKFGKYVINEVEPYNTEMLKLLQELESDNKLLDYSNKLEMVNRLRDYDFNNPLLVLPYKIGKQDYTINFDICKYSQFINGLSTAPTKDCGVNALFIPEKKESDPLKIKINDDYNLISVTNLNDIDEKVKYSKSNDVITINNHEGILYSVKVEFDNGDIVSYIVS